MNRSSILMITLTGVLLTTPLVARNKLPETTPDGLVLQDQSELGAVYAKPGADLKDYDQIMLVDTYVAFKKDWQRDYNRTRLGLGDNLTDNDVEKIKSEVASEFSKVFSQFLTDGGYAITDQTGPDVLIVRPAIINLDMTAPDLKTPGMRATIVSSAGSLTLYMELYDSVTSDKFAEVFDNEEAGDRGFGYRATRASNKQALDRVLRHWAGLLVKRLDEAHGKSE